MNRAIQALDRRCESEGQTLSAGVVVVRWQGDQPCYLLVRAYNHWDFPKGIVGSEETPYKAAIREVYEETTLNDLVFHWGECYKETPPYAHRKVARYYIAESPSDIPSLPVSPELGRPEHHEYRWVDYQQARSLVSERLKPILDWAHEKVSP